MIPLSRSWGNQNTISFSTSFLVYFWHMFLFCDMLLNNSFVRTLWLPISSFKKWDMTTMKPNWQSQFSLQKQLAKLDLFSYIKKKKFWLCFSSQINYLVHMPMTVPQFQKQREPSTNWPHFLTSLRMARAWHPGPNSTNYYGSDLLGASQFRDLRSVKTCVAWTGLDAWILREMKRTMKKPDTDSQTCIILVDD